MRGLHMPEGGGGERAKEERKDEAEAADEAPGPRGMRDPCSVRSFVLRA